MRYTWCTSGALISAHSMPYLPRWGLNYPNGQCLSDWLLRWNLVAKPMRLYNPLALKTHFTLKKRDCEHHNVDLMICEIQYPCTGYETIWMCFWDRPAPSLRDGFLKMLCRNSPREPDAFCILSNTEFVSSGSVWTARSTYCGILQKGKRSYIVEIGT